MLKFIRTHDHNLPLPSRGSDLAAGLDLSSAEDVTLHHGERKAIGTGFAWDTAGLPYGTYGRIAPRSGHAFNYGIDVLAGVIDMDYQGEIKVILINTGERPFKIEKGDRIAQLILEQCLMSVPEEGTAHSSETERGESGFGSTG